jgi:hypothetical protein
MEFKKANNITGWVVFLIATAVYFITLEPTVSLWDCGEYITAAYKLEVGHPPGAPLFMMLGRLFSFFAEPAEVAKWINRMSALASSFTILFMFWTISMFAKKIALSAKRTLENGESIAILGAATVGALAYTFSDSFWFSAVEGEVYSMASFFTAIVFWALMKFDHELSEKKHGEIDVNTFSERWLIFIFFMLGLAIGVHLLGLLIIPSIAYVLYFNSSRKVNFGSFVVVGIIGVVALAFVQDFLIPGTISIASSFEVLFTNTFGLPFFSGSILFFVLLIGATAYLIRWTRVNKKFYVHIGALCFAFLLIGYGSFATIVIRSNANTPLDENDPENLVTLHSYLKREQYGSAPILYGPYWNSSLNENREDWKDRSPVYLRRFVVTQNDVDIKAFKDEKRALAFAKEAKGGAEVIEKYFFSNEESYKDATPTYAQNTIFPRMFSPDEPSKINAYKTWSGYDANEEMGTEIGGDKKRIPTFGENMAYFMKYQVDWMYFRYFMWNFAGRQNDIQGHGDAMRGNWLTGFKSLDAQRLGAQGKDAPQYTSENPANNKLYLLPLILGLIGLIYHFFKAPKDAFIIFLTFIFTGLAIVIYLNQKPFEPRERDYAYAASFYAFAMWIGMSVYALYDGIRSFDRKTTGQSMLIIIGSSVLFFVIAGGLLVGSMTASLMLWGYIIVIGALLVGLFILLRKSLGDKAIALTATVITLAVPTLMMVQGWDDHNRAEKTSAHDLAYNYMMSCNQNGIIFTNGDNDTFPLWYLQEVEGVRKDLRVANLSLMSSDWYTDQMKLKTYSSDPLPIKFTEDQICSYSGGTDQVLMLSYLDMYSQGWAQQENMKKMIQRKLEINAPAFAQWKVSAKGLLEAMAQTMKVKQPEVETSIRSTISALDKDSAGNDVSFLENAAKATIMLIQGKGQEIVTIDPGLEKQLQDFMTNFDQSWDFLPATESLDYMRNDKNMVSNQGNTFRISPACGFTFPVNIQNAIDSKIIRKDQADLCHKEIKLRIDESSLMKSDLMSLDIIANNNWKRSIYFSSAGSNAISKAFYRYGHIKQNGMAAELSPLLDRNIVEMDKMYNNLMNVYHYGKMNKKGVLTDYYTRRHTQNFRQLFEQLAGSYMQEAAQADQLSERFNATQMGLMRQAGQFKQIDSIQKIINSAPAKKAAYNAKIIKLINKSVSVMPVDLVFDFGEPMPQNTEKGVRTRDGILQNYVQLLFAAGDKKGANKLGNDVARQLETIINYFQKSDVNILAQNSDDLMASLHAYFVLNNSSSNPKTGDADGSLATRTNKVLMKFLQTDFQTMLAKMNNIAMDEENDNMKEAMVTLKGELDEMMQEFGFSQGGKSSPKMIGK